METDVEAYLRQGYKGQIADIEILEKEDLDLVSLPWMPTDIFCLLYLCF